jgi:prepilin-type N-terminal cleavage/methylation domain-containing protein
MIRQRNCSCGARYGHVMTNRCTKGITLIEVIVSLAVIALIAAIVFPAIARSKDSALRTKEEASLRQIYVAVNLYEADFDQQALPSLDHLQDGYLKLSFLESSTDARSANKLADWPANPWVNIAEVDRPEYFAQRSSVRVAYFYLKPFEGRFPSGRSFAEYRNEPEVGMVTGLGLLKCDGPCEHGKRNSIQSGHPASNLHGDLGTVKMDGSIQFRKMSRGCQRTLGHLHLFLGANLGCKESPVTPI